MNELNLVCPHCSTEIKLTESLAAPLVASVREQYEQKLVQKEQDYIKREQALHDQEKTLESAQKSLDEQIATKLKTEREKISLEEAKKAKLVMAIDFEQKNKEITDLNQILKAREEKLAEAQNAQAELIRKQRELDDEKRELELTVEKRVEMSLTVIREQTKKEVEENLKLRVQEKEQTILAMSRQIEDLKRRAEQGSQQLQGEVLELELESLLRNRFPNDVIEPVPKGEFGGDILHRVFGASGMCGTILWESKRTRHWNDSWLAKLRDDQRAAKAEIALIISQTLPKGVNSFDFIDGIWVVEPRCLIPIAVTLRHSLVELASARQSSEGQQTKMEMVYQYLTGPRFRQRVQAIVEKFSDMQEDLDRERKTMTRLWAKREEQIRGVIEATSGMYGDLQGIAGKSFAEIEGLNVKLLEEVSN